MFSIIAIIIAAVLISCASEDSVSKPKEISKIVKVTNKVEQNNYSDYYIKKFAYEKNLSKADIAHLLARPINNSIRTFGKNFKCSERDLRIAMTAMACLETGNLKSKSMYVNNLFGIKLVPGRPQFVIKTKEYIDGKWITPEDNFVVFFSIEDCTNGYFRFLMKDRYQKVRNAKNYKEYLSAILECGYCTDPNYTDKIYPIADEIAKAI